MRTQLSLKNFYGLKKYLAELGWEEVPITNHDWVALHMRAPKRRREVTVYFNLKGSHENSREGFVVHDSEIVQEYFDVRNRKKNRTKRPKPLPSSSSGEPIIRWTP